MTTLLKPVETPRVAASTSYRGLGVLDAVRGATALYVLIGHAAILLFASRHDAALVSRSARAIADLLSVFAFGHQAVIMFFVLSGFCIHWKQSGGSSSRPFDANDYARRRLRRIAPPYYFAIVLTGICSVAMSSLTHGRPPVNTGNYVADLLLIQHNQWWALLGNLLFLQWIVTPTFGTNTALWSLSYEFFFYWLYLIYLPLRIRLGVAKSAGVVAAISTAAFFVSRHSFYILDGFSQVVAYWFVWVLGAVGAELFRADPDRRAGRPAEAGLILACVLWLVSTRTLLLPTALSDTIGGIICLGLLLTWVRREQAEPARGGSRGIKRALDGVGAFSYSLYLIHVPLLGVIATAWLVRVGHQPTSPWLFLASLPIVVFAAWISYRLVERRFLTRS